MILTSRRSLEIGQNYNILPDYRNKFPGRKWLFWCMDFMALEKKGEELDSQCVVISTKFSACSVYNKKGWGVLQKGKMGEERASGVSIKRPLFDFTLKKRSQLGIIPRELTQRTAIGFLGPG